MVVGNPKCMVPTSEVRALLAPDIVEVILKWPTTSNLCKIHAGRSSPMERRFNEVDAASRKQAVGSVNDFCPGP
jgi:hypothetical protein